ncbi:hypothetical protein [Streptomyces sp. NBC_00096]|uniref:hypothetical protein n=1 Tax=Streptomyces sp. NBC_00096 TaxID=2975650 RepID=UPI00324CA46C
MSSDAPDGESLSVRPDLRLLCLPTVPLGVLTLLRAFQGGFGASSLWWLALGAVVIASPFVLSRALAVTVTAEHIDIRKGWSTRRLRTADLRAVRVEHPKGRRQVYAAHFGQEGEPEVEVGLTAIRPGERRALIEAIRSSVGHGVLQDTEALREFLG